MVKLISILVIMLALSNCHLAERAFKDNPGKPWIVAGVDDYYAEKSKDYSIRCDRGICFIYDQDNVIITDAQYVNGPSGFWRLKVPVNEMQGRLFSIPYRTSILHVFKKNYKANNGHN